MKLAATLLWMIPLATALALAQNQYVKNVIVVIEENRTPDNLFQALCNPSSNCGTGSNVFNLQSWGNCLYNNSEQQVSLLPLPLENNCANPGHNHSDWTAMYNGVNNHYMDGACNDSSTTCGPPFKHGCTFGSGLDCTRYSYVDNSSGIIQPYLDVAKQYGWANNMFQTNQGPSFPAHQFLLSGSSAPITVPPPFETDLYQYFAMDLPTKGGGDGGCAASTGTTETLISPTGDTSAHQYPCFEHPTLTDLLDNANIPWRYYSGKPNGIWTAPNAISHMCNNSQSNGGGSCGSGTGSNKDWNSVILESQGHLAPFLNDLQPGNCNFPANWPGGVIFVVPDGEWSDHPDKGVGLGPDWVANIVNAIGQNNCGTTGNQPNWSNTVILITWDDWGGWYDHVLPYNYNGNNGKGGYTNGTGEQYVYGFRVPLLVVSEWVNNDSLLGGGHISNVDHDFGSILSFIEQAYGITSNIYPSYEYADFFAPDNPAPLADFFCYPPACQNPPHATFHPIGLYTSSYCNSSTCPSTECQSGQCACDATCFIKYKGSPKDPDDD
jgi:phospholipase C